MPIHGYPGNVITANPVAPTSTVATGVWTTEQQLKAVAAGNWPFTIPTQQVSLSARFNSADSAYLNRTPASASNRKTWTWSGWVKRTTVNTTGQNLFSTDNGSSTTIGQLFFNDAILEFNCYASSAYQWRLITTQVWRDLSAWYHIVAVVDTTQATSSNRVKLYVNGTQITAFSTATYPSQNFDGAYNLNQPHYIGAAITSSGYLNGYLAEVNFIDGQALTPASFGQTNAGTGVWEPIAYTGTYGTNGFYLPFNYDSFSFSADFLVVAGGGSGAIRTGAGGGAGGYRTSVGTSGGGGSAESSLTLSTGTPYTVTVGAGGAAVTGSGTVLEGNSGSNSVFSTVTSTGGGYGGKWVNPVGTTGGTGGSGGGGGGTETGTSAANGGSGTANQGYNGGGGNQDAGGGGGGAGAAGATATNGGGGAGGNGVASSITGSSVTRAGGGGGSSITGGSGGSGGGGAGGSNNQNGTDGTTNTGSGGGGGRNVNSPGNVSGAGGSGVIIIKIADTRTATFSSGVTSSLSTAVSGFKIYTVTATSTTSETVTFT